MHQPIVGRRYSALVRATYYSLFPILSLNELFTLTAGGVIKGDLGIYIEYCDVEQCDDGPVCDSLYESRVKCVDIGCIQCSWLSGSVQNYETTKLGIP